MPALVPVPQIPASSISCGKRRVGHRAWVACPTKSGAVCGRSAACSAVGCCGYNLGAAAITTAVTLCFSPPFLLRRSGFDVLRFCVAGDLREFTHGPRHQFTPVSRPESWAPSVASSPSRTSTSFAQGGAVAGVTVVDDRLHECDREARTWAFFGIGPMILYSVTDPLARKPYQPHRWWKGGVVSAQYRCIGRNLGVSIHPSGFGERLQGTEEWGNHLLNRSEVYAESLFCVRSAVVQVNDRRDEQSKDTNKKFTPICVSFSPRHIQGGLKKSVEDGMHACYVARCAGRGSTIFGKRCVRLTGRRRFRAGVKWDEVWEVGGGRSGGSEMGMGRLGFFVAEVGRSGGEMTGDVKPEIPHS
ncbi:hypothetical protein EDB85DRAFT_1903150 [Lactarius pseudohatsudake]|nr:hypothetical protein EDB85DRAFT_1903150 [Lactarius pseudohatsudake]